MAKISILPICRGILPAGVLLAGLLLTSMASPAEEEEKITDFQSLRNSLLKQGAKTLSFDLQGIICESNPKIGTVLVRDASSTVILEMPSIPDTLSAGTVVKISGRNSWVNRSTHSIQLDTGPLLEVDGLHAPFTQSATITLEEGDQPFRLEWFNGDGPAKLNLEVEGPDLHRAKVPESWYKHRSPDGGTLLPGLGYARYRGTYWHTLPNFPALKEESRGETRGLDNGLIAAEGSTGLIYSGFLTLPRTGNYTFSVASDDGARVFVGKPNSSISIVSSLSSTPVAAAPTVETDVPGDDQFWGTSEGVVTFAGQNDHRIELELSGKVAVTHITVLDPGDAVPQNYLGKMVKVTGLKSTSGVVALSPRSIEVSAQSNDPKRVITTAAEIHQLRPAEAQKGRPVRLVGVVTMVSPQNIVLQDSSGGVYVHHTSSRAGDTPKPKEIWEVTGITDDGDFSPVVRNSKLSYKQVGELPRGLKPTREQFADGSLDAEQVEIEGIVASSSPLQLELLTQEGSISIKNDTFYPLPTHNLSDAENASLVGSVVSIRGVYTATWNSSTRRVTPSQVRLGNAVLSITSPTPADLFDVELIKASDLLLFNSETRALQRVKVAGTVLLAKPSELFVHDGASGFRVLTRNGSDLKPGDQIEVVGFPRLEGVSPILLQAQTRKIGSTPLPKPIELGEEFVSNPHLDASLVSIHGRVISDTKRENSRTLELEKSSITFLAHIPMDSNSSVPFRKGSVLDLTGVYIRENLSHAGSTIEPFEIEVGNTTDITIEKTGPWWTQKHTIVLIFTLCGLLLVTSIGATLLQRTVVKRTEEISIHIKERETTERQRVLDQERSRVAQDLHDELGAGLTEAGILAALAKNPSIPDAKKEDYLVQLGGVCRTLVTGLDEIVWAVNPNYDAVADLAGYFSLFAQKFLQLADIRCRLNIAEEIPSHRLSSQLRHGIFLAFKEALNNIVKHSGATLVHLTIEIRDRNLYIVIADNGKSFKPGLQGARGEGLGGMETRIKQLGGEFNLQAGKEEGVVVTFRIPLEIS